MIGPWRVVYQLTFRFSRAVRDNLRAPRDYEDRGVRALRRTLWLGAAEVLVWLGLGWAHVATRGVPLLQGVVAYVVERFGEIAIALATTAYVVFTYYLLVGSEAERKRASEPFIRIDWELGGTRAQRFLGKCEQLGAELQRLFQDAFGLDLRPQDSAALDQRFLHLAVTNTRPVPVEWLRIQATSEVSIPRQEPFSIVDGGDYPSLGIREGDKLLITLVDLGSIPATAKVRVRLDTLEYGPAETGVTVTDSRGEREYQTTGVLLFSTPRAELEPPRSTGGGQQP